MRYLSVLFVSMVLMTACSGPTGEELASLAAKGYYSHLIHEEYDSFMAGKSGADSLPQDYREQLIDNLRQFTYQQQRDHHGIREVRVVNAKTDTLQQYTNVFLVLCFGDSTNEEVVVPMVEQDGRWFMK